MVRRRFIILRLLGVFMKYAKILTASILCMLFFGMNAYARTVFFFEFSKDIHEEFIRVDTKEINSDLGEDILFFSIKRCSLDETLKSSEIEGKKEELKKVINCDEISTYEESQVSLPKISAYLTGENEDEFFGGFKKWMSGLASTISGLTSTAALLSAGFFAMKFGVETIDLPQRLADLMGGLDQYDRMALDTFVYSLTGLLGVTEAVFGFPIVRWIYTNTYEGALDSSGLLEEKNRKKIIYKFFKKINAKDDKTVVSFIPSFDELVDSLNSLDAVIL